MNAWKTACDWYKPNQIYASLTKTKASQLGWPRQYNIDIPANVRSHAFAEWLTEQYRLAMAKGIQIGQEAAIAAAKEPPY